MMKTPKANWLREKREERYHAEKVRQRAEKLRLEQASIIAVKTRSKQAKIDEGRAAEAAMRGRK